eukprot:COSAG02_NODE_1348_length_13137_cov_10.847293_2_plen_733_part_00
MAGDSCEVHKLSAWVSGVVLDVKMRGSGHERGDEPETSTMTVSLQDGSVSELCVDSSDVRPYHGETRDIVRLRQVDFGPSGFRDAGPQYQDVVVEASVASNRAIVRSLSVPALKMLVSQMQWRNQPQLQAHLRVQKDIDRKQEISDQKRRAQRRYVCWGPKTWVFVDDERRFTRLQNLMVGDRVLTADGVFRAVTKIWISDYSDPKRNTELCYFRGVWMTSHHPVLLGQDFIYPAHLEASFPASPIATQIGPMINLELSGHLDTVILAGGADAPVWPPFASCTVGKYLGKQFGYGFWTRRSTKCVGACAQCDRVHVPGFDPTRADSDRWATYSPFVEVEYRNGRRASFWPNAAERCWTNAGLTRNGLDGLQQRHRSAAEAVSAVTGRSVTAPNPNPAWKVGMLARLDASVASGRQQFTTKTMDCLLDHHVAKRTEAQRDSSTATTLRPKGPRASSAVATKSRCFLCLDGGDEQQLVRPCVDDSSCGATFCRPCWARHLQICTVDTSRYACPVVSCPFCLTVLPLDVWSGHSSEQQPDEAVRMLGEAYSTRAEDILRVACAGCGHTDSILPTFDLSLDFNSQAGDSVEVRAAQKAWMRCAPGAAVELAAVLSKRLSATQMHGVLSSVANVERRLSLQLAWLRTRPAVPGVLIGCGCEVQTCFLCKGLATTANGASCDCTPPTTVEAVAARGDGSGGRAKCSACGLPSPMHDPNCASVMCVCGKYTETQPHHCK